MDLHDDNPGESTGRFEQNELQRAHADLERALAERDAAAISAANKKIRAVREQIHAGRRALSSLAAERIDLVEVIERARLQLLRYERHLEDHDRKLEKLRHELRQLGARLPDHPLFSTFEPVYLSDEADAQELPPDALEHGEAEGEEESAGEQKHPRS